ncbi:MAG: DUF502 domain-containing protein [Phycisphaerae bacterium]
MISSPAPSSPDPIPDNAPKAAASSSFRRHLQSVFIGGFVVLIPLLVTLYIVSFLYHFATGFSYPVAQWMLQSNFFGHLAPIDTSKAAGYLAPLLAVLLTVGFIYLIGVLSTFVIGRQILNVVDRFVENLPLLKGIYGTTKQVIGVFRQSGGGAGFQRVVLVEFPRRELWTIAFVTNEITDTSCGKKYITIFIPMTPNPTSGFFQMVLENDVRNTNWTVDQGIKIVLSGGLLAPAELNFGATRNLSE